MTDDNKLSLSRRKALLGLGTIGVAGAGAGIGTSALFSDTEEFANNLVQAGTTNLIAEAEIVSVSSELQNNGTVTLEDADSDDGTNSTVLEADGTMVAGLTVSDMKPGDSFIVRVTVEVNANPMYVTAVAANADDSEGVNTEPENTTQNGGPNPDTGGDAVGDGSGNDAGDLDNRILVTFGYDGDQTSGGSADRTLDASSITPDPGLGFDGSASATATSFLNTLQGNGLTYRGQAGGTADPPGGHRNTGSPTRIGGNENANNVDREQVTHFIKFELPASVGNEVQGDSFSFDLGFEAEQVRNNRVVTSGPVPTTQQTKLTPNDGDSDDNFGGSVAMDGDTVLIGAESDEEPNGTVAGSAYVFTRSGGSWSQQDKLDANDGDQIDTFGNDVSVDGDTAVVGAPFDETTGSTSVGSAYIFTRSGGSWSQQAKLTANDAASQDQFGFGVAVDGDTAVIGAPGDEGPNGTNAAGSAYVFTRSGGSWSQQAKLTATNLEDNDGLGSLVALDGNTAILGAPAVGRSGSESAYVFTRSSGSWSRQAELTGDGSGDDDGFGLAVAMEGDTAVIGAPSDEDPNGSGAGSAYVFTRSGGSWSQQTKLDANDGDSGDNFGTWVALDGGTAVVGAPSDEDPNGSGAGSAYVFGP